MPDQSQQHIGSRISFFDLAVLVKTNRFIFSLVFVASVISSIAYALLTTPVYQSEVLLASTARGQLGALQALSGRLGALGSFIDLPASEDAQVEEAIAIMRSRDFTTKFIEEESLLPILFYKKWDSDNNEWDVKQQSDIPTISDAYRYFDRNVRKIEKERNTGLIRVSINWIDPDLAADWANKLVSRLNQEARNREISEAQSSLKHLKNEQKKNVDRGVEAAIYSLMEEQLKRNMYASVKKEFAFKVIDPAVASDADDFVSPNRPLVVIGGALMGLVLGFSAVLARAAAVGPGKS